MKRNLIIAAATVLIVGTAAWAADIIKGRVDGTGATYNVNVDSSGRVRTSDEQIDDAAFTAGDPVSASGYVFDDTSPDTVNEGDAGYGRMSTNRCQYMMVRDGQGNERGAYVNASGQLSVDVGGVTGLPVLVDDAAFTPATSKVMMSGFEFDDTTPDSVDEGDAGAARMSANRNIYMTLRDAAGNERGANITAGNALEIDIAEQSLTAVAVSATSAANATANRIYTHANVDQIGGTAVNVNGGAKDGGTQTVTLATDDPAVTALQIIDDWDSSDTAKVTIAAQTLTAVAISDDASANAEGNPIYAQPVAPVFDDDGSANCVAITAASVQFTLPGNDAYEVCGSGGTAYILCGANPTATTAVGNFSFIVGDGQCHRPAEYGSAKCAVIGSVAAGFVCFKALDYN